MENRGNYDSFKKLKNPDVRKALLTNVKKKRIKDYTEKDRNILKSLKMFYIDRAFLIFSFMNDTKEVKNYRLAKVSEAIETCLWDQQCSTLILTEQMIEKKIMYWSRKNIKEVTDVGLDFDVTQMVMYEEEMEQGVIARSVINDNNNTFKCLVYRLHHFYGMPFTKIEKYISYFNRGGAYLSMIEEAYGDALVVLEPAYNERIKEVPYYERDNYDKKYREELFGSKETTGRVGSCHRGFVRKAKAFRNGMGRE